jgi:hypothetical protein
MYLSAGVKYDLFTDCYRMRSHEAEQAKQPEHQISTADDSFSASWA